MTQLQSPEDTVQSDPILVHWARLQFLVDELIAQIPLDAVNVTDAKARAACKTFEKQLKDWEDEQRSNGYESCKFLLALFRFILHYYDIVRAKTG